MLKDSIIILLDTIKTSTRKRPGKGTDFFYQGITIDDLLLIFEKYFKNYDIDI